MLQLFEPRPDLRAAHVFADHLEATLDLAEELELLHLIPTEAERGPGRDVRSGLDRVGAFVERIEAIELAIAAKLELARRAAVRIANADVRLSSFTRLFHSGTQPLVDLCPELADPGRRIFDSGHDPLTFLQARGVVEESRCTMEGQRFLGTGTEYLLLGTVKLGAFIALCDTCLEALDRHYHIYEDDAGWEARRAGTIEVLRERRDEAIRVALGAVPEVIETPIEMVASDAVDEAIELIEALTFPEEKRFVAEPPVIETPDAAVDDLLDPLAEAVVAEEMPIALGLVEAMPELPADVVLAPHVEETGLPFDLETGVVVENAADDVAGIAAEPAAVPVTDEAVDGSAERPALFAPITAARRSLAALLVRRKTTTPVSVGPEAAVEAASLLTAARQRLVDVIAERAAAPSEADDPGQTQADAVAAADAAMAVTAGAAIGAFSSEVVAGSRQENATNHKSRAAIRFHRIATRSGSNVALSSVTEDIARPEAELAATASAERAADATEVVAPLVPPAIAVPVTTDSITGAPEPGARIEVAAELLDPEMVTAPKLSEASAAESEVVAEPAPVSATGIFDDPPAVFATTMPADRLDAPKASHRKRPRRASRRKSMPRKRLTK